MPKLDSIEPLLIQELRDLLDAETQITKALPKMMKATSSDELRSALEEHLEQTKGQIERLHRAFEALDETPKAKRCHGMRGLIEEGKELMEEDAADAALDAALIGAAQKVEHYEIAAYGTARTLATMIGQEEVASLLEETLDEEKAADERLTEIAETLVNPQAADDEESATSATSRGGARKTDMAGRRAATASSRLSRASR